MFSDKTILRDNIEDKFYPILYESGSPIVSSGSPIASLKNQIVFDLGYDFDYEFQINVKCEDLQFDYKMVGVVFNQKMSVDLYEVLTNIQYINIIHELFERSYHKKPHISIPIIVKHDDIIANYFKKYIKNFKPEHSDMFVYFYFNHVKTRYIM